MFSSVCFRFYSFLRFFKNTQPVLQSLTNGSVNFTNENYRCYSTKVKQEILNDYSKIENEMSKEIFERVNDQIAKKTHGRLFAVVYLQGVQFKVTTEDLIVIRHHWPPTAGDKIRLEKVMLVGSSDFTLIGRPLLPSDQVTVLATVIEKTLTHPYPRFRFKPRQNYMKLSFYKDELTYLRITDIIINKKINELGDTDGLEGRIFQVVKNIT